MPEGQPLRGEDVGQQELDTHAFMAVAHSRYCLGASTRLGQNMPQVEVMNALILSR